ncbi:hypothetical protein A3K79_01795 [Candidatus Bathyarchaeota archaeon RBG_13_46_16b]|nr:MAG: hypothetical protein A3K79_01795 [Candidatus Bathyarchaeota archaeon RBG_13_46_16b]
MQEKKTSIAIPASVVSDTPHLREKTSKIGLIGRAAAIFRVNEIIIYTDELKTDQTVETRLIALLLSYMETPQYLRKQLFKLQPELQFAGILPPLRTPHHPLNHQMKRLKVGEYREGTVLSKRNEDMFVDIGVEQPAIVRGKHLVLGKRITVKIADADRQIKAELANREDISEYWGYSTIAAKQSFGEMVKQKDFDCIIATSKHGRAFLDVADVIAEKWRTAHRSLVAFGAPTHGLNEIAEEEGLDLSTIADIVVNTIPNQGTETVRTEEAVLASLAILNTLNL